MATRNAEAKAPGKRGRPSRFSEERCEQARKLCLLGATDKQLADFFEVSEQTLNNWKKQHPEFLESLKKGKVQADANVAAALYHRAIGYSHPAVKIFQDKGKPVVVPYTEHFPPDTAAAFIWLKNRQPERWREKPDPDDTPDVPLPVKVIVQVQDASVAES